MNAGRGTREGCAGGGVKMLREGSGRGLRDAIRGAGAGAGVGVGGPRGEEGSMGEK